MKERVNRPFKLYCIILDRRFVYQKWVYHRFYYREEQEKMNVWVAYLNLENMYGSSDSLQKILNRAVQQCDDVQVYLQMINIYCKSEKLEVESAVIQPRNYQFSIAETSQDKLSIT